MGGRLSRLAAVAANTFRETVRERVLYNLVFFAIIMTLAGLLLGQLSIRQDEKVLKDIGIWFELVILIIPTLNDSPAEIERMSAWVLEQLGPDVPMHFTRFHPTYRITNLPRTPVSTLERCRRIAVDAGIRYVYAGNVPGHPHENTNCHGCGSELIRRVGFRVVSNAISNGKCPKCGTVIPGVWSQAQALALKP